MKPLSIVAYFDGRPGHEKQTRGILQALAAITATSVVHKKVRVSPAAYCRNWTAYILSSLRSPEAHEFFGTVDLIVGTGTHTHIPVLLEKEARAKLSGALVRVVTCMGPDALLRGKFDLCCIPAHDEPAPADNVFLTLGPPNTVRCEGKQQDDRGLILVGGVDTKSHVWKSEKTAAQLRIIIDRNPALHWTISSSPRTPENTCLSLEAMAASMKNVSFFRSSQTPAGWIEEQYALNRTVWVTADSISMVYEALTAGCSVGVLPVEWLRNDNKFNKSLNFLSREKMIVAFDAWQEGTPLPAPKDELLDESKRCAEEILRRWWPDRLK